MCKLWPTWLYPAEVKGDYDCQEREVEAVCLELLLKMHQCFKSYTNVLPQNKTTYYGNYAPVVSWELPADRLPANLNDNLLLFLCF